MGPCPLTLTLAFAFLLAVDPPFLTLSLPVSPPLLRQPLPPPLPPHPRPSSPPPPPSLSPPPPSPQKPPRSPPPQRGKPPRSSAEHNDVRGTPGRPPRGRPPAPRGIASRSDCDQRRPPRGWRGQRSGGPICGAEHQVSGLNLGKKVGLAFVGVVVVLQIVFGSFLIYRRRQIRKTGYWRDLGSSGSSSSPSASSSAT